MSLSLSLPVAAQPPIALCSHRAAAVPAGLYLVLSLADMLCSLAAFSHGIAEGNPFMAWLLAMNWFVPGKIAVSLLVAALMVVVYSRAPHRRWVVWGGVGVMVAVFGLHLWALPRLLLAPVGGG